MGYRNLQRNNLRFCAHLNQKSKSNATLGISVKF